LYPEIIGFLNKKHSPNQPNILTMKRLTLLLLIVTTSFILLSCGTDEETRPIPQYPILKVINESNESIITSVLLVNYEFHNINITGGKTQTFKLDQGMPSGNKDISVTIHYFFANRIWVQSIDVDFKDGDITEITLPRD
jgi:hypothetical protein